MKTLSQLIQEAIERFENRFATREYPYKNKVVKPYDYMNIRNFWKQELETIVKESFKNTRVEEGLVSWSDETNDGYQEALADKQEKENQFLNN